MVGAIGLIVLVIVILLVISFIGKSINFIKDKKDPNKLNSNADINSELEYLKKLKEKGLANEESVKNAQKKIIDKHLK